MEVYSIKSANYPLVFTAVKSVFDNVYSRLSEDDKNRLDREITYVELIDVPLVKSAEQLESIIYSIIEYGPLLSLPRGTLEMILLNLPYKKTDDSGTVSLTGAVRVLKGLQELASEYQKSHMDVYMKLRKPIEEQLSRKMRTITADDEESFEQKRIAVKEEVIRSVMSNFDISLNVVRKMVSPIGVQFDYINMFSQLIKMYRPEIITLAYLERERKKRAANNDDIFVPVDFVNVIQMLDDVEQGKKNMLQLKVALYHALDDAYEATMRYRRDTDFLDKENGEDNWMRYLSDNFPTIWEEKVKLNEMASTVIKFITEFGRLAREVDAVKQRHARDTTVERTASFKQFDEIGTTFNEMYDRFKEALKNYDVQGATLSYSTMRNELENATKLRDAIVLRN